MSSATGRARVVSPLAALLLVCCLREGATAAGSAPPAEYLDLYTFLDQKLDGFERSLTASWDGSRYPVTFATELLTANGNRGRQLLGPQAIAGARMELDRLHTLGIQAVTVAIPFPILYPPFLEWNGDPDDHERLVDFFAQISAEAHARGMKLYVETAAMFPGVYSAGSGMNAAGYYPTLTDAQYVAGRAAVIETIVRRIRPDLLNLGSEPDTEQRLSGKVFLASPVAGAAMIRGFVEQLAAAGLGDVPLVAGSGTWHPQASSYVTELCKIPGLWGIDLHVYPVNRSFLEAAVSLAAQAHAAGKKVTMLECWLQKERDSELGTIDSAFDSTIFARDAFDFWAPLDQKFLAAMVTYANVAKVDALSPFWSRYFGAYLDYEAVSAQQPALTPDQVIALASAAHAQAIGAGQTTATGRAYASWITAASGTPTVTKVVPIVLDAPGVGGARFTTELTLANRGTTTASVELDYRPAAALSGVGSGHVTTSLGAGHQIVIADVVSYLRDGGLAIPSGGNQGGSLRVTFTGLSGADVASATARTTTPSGSGRAGLAYAGPGLMDARTGTSIVYGLRSTADDRTNLALVNAADDAPVTLRTTLVSGAAGDGRFLTLTPDVTLAPGEWTQLSRVLDLAGFTNGYARIDVVSGAGPYLAYAIVNDNATNDGSYIPAEPALAPREPQFVPVLVESATFRSELVLANPQRQAATATLRYVESAPSAGGGGGTVTIALAPGEQKILPDAVEVLRQAGVLLGPKGSASFAGALSVSFSAGGSPSVGFAGARTASPVAGAGPGAYGVFTPGVGLGSTAVAETWVFGLQQNASNRSNLALVNTGSGGGAIVLRVDVHDGETGRLAGSEPPVTVPAGGWVQLNLILQRFHVASGYAHIVKIEGKSRFLAYGVVNDGGTPSSGGTDDGSTLGMSGH